MSGRPSQEEIINAHRALSSQTGCDSVALCSIAATLGCSPRALAEAINACDWQGQPYEFQLGTFHLGHRVLGRFCASMVYQRPTGEGDGRSLSEMFDYILGIKEASPRKGR